MNRKVLDYSGTKSIPLHKIGNSANTRNTHKTQAHVFLFVAAQISL